jgi:hypothetical protein
MADVSISHDGDYAIAVVQALDVQSPPTQKLSDDGRGKPIHVPRAGDLGFPEILRPQVLHAVLTGYTPEGNGAGASTEEEAAG